MKIKMIRVINTVDLWKSCGNLKGNVAGASLFRNNKQGSHSETEAYPLRQNF
jgi:hypothetical protein